MTTSLTKPRKKLLLTMAAFVAILVAVGQSVISFGSAPQGMLGNSAAWLAIGALFTLPFALLRARKHFRDAGTAKGAAPDFVATAVAPATRAPIAPRFVPLPGGQGGYLWLPDGSIWYQAPGGEPTALDGQALADALAYLQQTRP